MKTVMLINALVSTITIHLDFKKSHHHTKVLAAATGRNAHCQIREPQVLNEKSLAANHSAKQLKNDFIQNCIAATLLRADTSIRVPMSTVIKLN